VIVIVRAGCQLHVSKRIERPAPNATCPLARRSTSQTLGSGIRSDFAPSLREGGRQFRHQVVEGAQATKSVRMKNEWTMARSLGVLPVRTRH
jgi:hypothetical protein